MSESVTLSATLLSGPSAASDNAFPSGVTNLPFGLNPPQKSLNVQTGTMVVQLNSPGAFASLPGIGGSVGPVTQANLLYIRVTSPMLVRTTTFNPSGPSVVAVEPIAGVKLVEFDPTRYLSLLEVQGAGTVEYYASGTQ